MGKKESGPKGKASGKSPLSKASKKSLLSKVSAASPLNKASGTGRAPIRDIVFDAFGRDPAFIARTQGAIDRLIDDWFDVEVTGLEHVPKHGRALLVANHGGALPYDALVLMALIAREDLGPLRPLLEDAVMTAPFLGSWMRRFGAVRASQDNAVRLLEREELCAVFPEGLLGLSKLWRHRYKLSRFGRGGFVRLAHKTATPIVPVTVLGAEDAAPLLRKINFLFRGTHVDYLPVTTLLPLPTRWSIRFSPPIDVRKELGKKPDALALSALAGRIRDDIQADLDTLTAAREGPYRMPF